MLLLRLEPFFELFLDLCLNVAIYLSNKVCPFKELIEFPKILLVQISLYEDIHDI